MVSGHEGAQTHRFSRQQQLFTCYRLLRCHRVLVIARIVSTALLLCDWPPPRVRRDPLIGPRGGSVFVTCSRLVSTSTFQDESVPVALCRDIEDGEFPSTQQTWHTPDGPNVFVLDS